MCESDTRTLTCYSQDLGLYPPTLLKRLISLTIRSVITDHRNKTHLDTVLSTVEDPIYIDN